MKMKAALSSEYNLLSIEEVTIPTPADNELLIKVEASTVNRTDCHNLSGEPFVMKLMLGIKKPKQPIQGTDFAGVVQKVGKKVTRFTVGDRIFGFKDTGLTSNAEYLTITENTPLAIIPENIGYQTAVSVIEGIHYAYNFLNKVDLTKGDTVIVNGGTGAIGSALVQLCSLGGAKVSATCRSEHMELMKKLGAETVIDYTNEDFTQSDEKYDYVFDAVGKNSFGNCRTVLKERGVYISSELGDKNENLFYSLRSLFWGKKKVKFPVPVDIQKSLDDVAQLLATESYKAVIDKSYSLDSISEAYKYAESGMKVGSLVVDMNQ